MNLQALYKISYGLYIVSSAKNGKLSAQIANTVFQLTSEPPKIGACLNKKNATYEFVKDSKAFAVSVLEKDTPMQFIGRFGFRSSRDFNKFEGINFRIGKTGSPIVLDHAVAFIEAKVLQECDVGTHTLFIGEVVDAEILKDAEVMTYEYYHSVKKGKTPETATVYIKK
uniref:Flavin reductase n=1 Tax=Archaeoglobus fulgidus TaxID=2234 RepID=A0A7J2TI24_ARCFL